MRVCFQLHVAVEHLEEYARRHAEVWPEMRQALSDSGWRNYSLFLAPDGTLTGYFECDDLDAAQAAMAATEVNGRWQQEMQHFFADLGDQRPDEGIRPIPEIFHLA
ncbi:MAG: L-rhamnose mutarotase [Frankiales bacterium]|jgi:L-rhamnose mutarotase|nr:L-rhamnose mutarotase [Frankiales bacterium]MDX6210194.1 L-rhamnose mutarotase [Frankiales bacterium]